MKLYYGLEGSRSRFFQTIVQPTTYNRVSNYSLQDSIKPSNSVIGFKNCTVLDPTKNTLYIISELMQVARNRMKEEEVQVSNVSGLQRLRDVAKNCSATVSGRCKKLFCNSFWTLLICGRRCFRNREKCYENPQGKRKVICNSPGCCYLQATNGCFHSLTVASVTV